MLQASFTLAELCFYHEWEIAFAGQPATHGGGDGFDTGLHGAHLYFNCFQNSRLTSAAGSS